MAKRNGEVAVVLAVLMGFGVPAIGRTNEKHRPGPAAPRVRTDNPVLRSLIGEAHERSETFRALVAEVQATDGVVYIEQGRCGHHVRACLAHSVTVSGANRLLRIVVDPGKEGIEAMAAIAHELRHALEVLSEPKVTSDEAVYFLYKRIGSWRGAAFETDAAVDAGLAVHGELRRSARSR